MGCMKKSVEDEPWTASNCNPERSQALVLLPWLGYASSQSVRLEMQEIALPSNCLEINLTSRGWGKVLNSLMSCLKLRRTEESTWEKLFETGSLSIALRLRALPASTS